MKSTCSDCIGRSSGTALSPITRKFGERLLRPIRCPMAADRADGIISETAAGVADRLHLCFQHIPDQFRKDGDRAGVSRSHSAALRIPRLRSAEGGRGELFPKRQIAAKAEAMFHTCLMIAWFALPVLVWGAMLCVRRRVCPMSVCMLCLASMVAGTFREQHHHKAAEQHKAAEIRKETP